MNYKSFDLKFKKNLKKLLKYADKKLPKKLWTLKLTFWNDNDYELRINTAEQEINHVFFYKKITQEAKYWKEDLKKCKGSISKVIYEEDIVL